MTACIFLLLKFREKQILYCKFPIDIKENTRQLNLQTKFLKTKNPLTLIPYSPFLLSQKRKHHFYLIMNNSSISLRIHF
jgi:hypothetical protein